MKERMATPAPTVAYMLAPPFTRAAGARSPALELLDELVANGSKLGVVLHLRRKVHAGTRGKCHPWASGGTPAQPSRSSPNAPHNPTGTGIAAHLGGEVALGGPGILLCGLDLHLDGLWTIHRRQ